MTPTILYASIIRFFSTSNLGKNWTSIFLVTCLTLGPNTAAIGNETKAPEPITFTEEHGLLTQEIIQQGNLATLKISKQFNIIKNTSKEIAEQLTQNKLSDKQIREMIKQKVMTTEGAFRGGVVFKRDRFNNTSPLYSPYFQKGAINTRHQQLSELGQTIDIKDINKSLIERDERDLTRNISPLKAANDAIVLDSTELNIESVLDKILELYKISDVRYK